MTLLGMVDWSEAKAAVRDAGSNFSAMVRRCDRGDAPALGRWDVTGLVVHLSTSLGAVRSMAVGTDSMLDDLSQLPLLTETLVSGETETDLGVLADRIDAGVASLLAVMEGSEDVSRPWLITGIEARLSTLTCHALNEIVVHGHDLAKAAGQPWPISPDHARLVLEGFLFPIIGKLGPAVVDAKASAGVRACFEVRVRGGERAYMTFEGGDVRVTATKPARVDCHLSVDPVAFLLVAWDRQSQWPAIARGQLVAWGRRPWLGVRLRSFVRNP